MKKMLNKVAIILASILEYFAYIDIIIASIVSIVTPILVLLLTIGYFMDWNVMLFVKLLSYDVLVFILSYLYIILYVILSPTPNNHLDITMEIE